jgi:hypothetical protein
MSNREQIRTSVPLAAPRRADTAARAAGLLGDHDLPGCQEPSAGTCKLTTRVRTDQLDWLQEQARTYHRRHPRAPKLTIEELVRLAVDQLREAPHLDSLIGRYRCG